MSPELEPLLVSVLTPIHRRLADHLGPCYESLKSQDLPPGWSWEWCLQEDGDDPVGPAGLGLPDDGRMSYSASGFEAAGPGLALTRNLALFRARGTVVALLDGDDILLPGALATLLGALATAPDLMWAAGRADDLLSDGNRRSFDAGLPGGRAEPGDVSRAAGRLGYFPFPGAGGAMRTVAAWAVGGAMAIPRADDISLWSVVTTCFPGMFVDEALFLYRQWDKQITAQPRFADLAPYVDMIRKRLDALAHLGLPRPHAQVEGTGTEAPSAAADR